MIACFDIDGVICTTDGIAYELAEPDWEVIRRINNMAADGDTIIFFTGRGQGSGIDYRKLTEQQLRDWHVRYDELHMGKPAADLYVDDKGRSFEEWWAAQ